MNSESHNTGTATSEHLATIRAERLVIESPVRSNPDVASWTVSLEEQEFVTPLRNAPASPFIGSCSEAVAVFLNVDDEGPDKVLVDPQSQDLVEPLLRARDAILTALDALQHVNKVTMPSRHI